jgi:hypothetical protein
MTTTEIMTIPAGGVAVPGKQARGVKKLMERCLRLPDCEAALEEMGF